MKIKLQFDATAKKTIAGHAKLGERIRTAVGETLKKQLVRTQNFIVEAVSGKSLQVRTGSLRRDVDLADVETSGRTITGSVVMRAGASEAYQKIQEFGGTITPKKGKALAIPLPGALTGSGVIKGKYNTDNLRSLNLTFIKNDKTGKAILAEVIQMKTKSKVTPLFALVPSVTIKGAHYMEDGMTLLRLELPDALENRIGEVIHGL